MASLAGSRMQSSAKNTAKMQTSINANDLLNFSLPPRQQRQLQSLPRRSRKTANVHGIFNKERFVNAQYRFVMNPTGDYTVHFADPDIFFQWNDILQILIPKSSALALASAATEEGFTTCPICLSPPTAPRMTKCGHVFCFACILHYLSISENKWARCPICFDSVNERQLKCVKWYDGGLQSSDGLSDTLAASSSTSIDDIFETTPTAGSTLTMRLIQRPQITTLALPRSHTWPSDILPPHQAPFHFLPDVYQFAKFMLATPAYLISDLTKDLDDLAEERRVLSGMDDGLSIIFVDVADRKVREQIARASAMDTSILREQVEKVRRDQADLQSRFEFQEGRRREEERVRALETLAPLEIPSDFLASRTGVSASMIASTANKSTPPARTAQHSRSQPRQRRNINPPPPTTSTYYYYQAASGLPLFLHPLDIRILLSHFNDYSSFPDRITVRIDSVAEGSVDDDLRKRCKYLAHFPEGADVVFLETDLEGVVGEEGLKNFEAPLKMRTARRKEKEKKEDRAKLRSEEKEKERFNRGTTSSWTSGHQATQHVLLTELPVESLPALGSTEALPTTTAPPAAGVWGARSFASALHSAPSRSVGSVANTNSQRPRLTAEDEYDLDVAWHELEQRNGGGGRRKRANKLVVLGSGGGGARRR